MTKKNYKEVKFYTSTTRDVSEKWYRSSICINGYNYIYHSGNFSLIAIVAVGIMEGAWLDALLIKESSGSCWI